MSKVPVFETMNEDKIFKSRKKILDYIKGHQLLYHVEAHKQREKAHLNCIEEQAKEVRRKACED